jgi:integrase
MRGRNRVRVYERTKGGLIYVAATDPSTGCLVRFSLGHNDKGDAVAWANEQSAKLLLGLEQTEQGHTPFSVILDAYLNCILPDRKTDAQRDRDRQRAELWRNFFGPQKDPTTIRPFDWRRFQRERGAGTIDARGRPVPGSERRIAGPRTLAADLTWLRGCLNWACAEIDEDGKPLLAHNPTNTDKKRAYRLPTEDNPRRVRATFEKYRMVAGHADLVACIGPEGEQGTCLRQLIELAWHTGRRITPILRLRHTDVFLEKTKEAPYGAILWRTENDKMGKLKPRDLGEESENRGRVVPINSAVREILVRYGVADVGDAWLFPHPMDPRRPVPRHMAQHWLLQAEKRAGYRHVKGFGFHSFRRGWATERKGLSDADSAWAGGWKNANTLRAVYQGATDEGVLKVVLHTGGSLS